VPYAYKPGLWIGYDNLESFANKVNYLKKMELGGVIVWSLDMDDHLGTVCNEGPYPVRKSFSLNFIIIKLSFVSTKRY
jgi:chitinase